MLTLEMMNVIAKKLKEKSNVCIFEDLAVDFVGCNYYEHSNCKIRKQLPHNCPLISGCETIIIERKMRGK